MEQEDLTERDLVLTLQVPGEQDTSVMVNSSKPVMDLLIGLCAQYHLNPSDHIMELISANQNHIKFKPSSLIGSLEAERVVLKPKGSEDNNKAVPNMPVATVRLLINYRHHQKAVVRVNPKVSLAELLPAVCEKCELDPNTTILLRDSQSEHPLDLTKTLNDYGIRDLYAKDTKVVSNAPKDPATPSHEGRKKGKLVTKKEGLEEKENGGFFRLFQRSKKTAEENNRTSCPQVNSATPVPPISIPKKRQAPQPPRMPSSQSSGSSVALPTASGKEGVLRCVSSSLKRTKRRAPPPPCVNPSLPDCSDKESCCVGSASGPTTLEETREQTVQSHLSDGSSNQYSDFTTPCSSIPSPSLMTEILYEYMDMLKAQEQEDCSTDSSVTYLPPTAIHSPPLQAVPSSPANVPDSDPIVPPGSGLLRHCSQREGLNTFTVVPRKKLPRLRHYEVLLTLEAQGSLDQGSRQTGILEPIYQGTENLESRNNETENLELEETESLKLNSTEIVTQEKVYGKCENLEERISQLCILEAAEKPLKLTLNGEIEKYHPEEKEKMADQVSEEGASDYVEEYREKRKKFHKCRSDMEHRKNEAENLEPNGIVMVSPEKACGQSENLEERNVEMDVLETAAATEAFSTLTHADTEKHHPEERDVLNDEEKDWLKLYKEKRKIFQGDEDDRKAVKLDRWMKEFKEGMICRKMDSEVVELEEGLPPPPSSVWVEMEENVRENHEERERKARIRTERQKEHVSSLHSNYDLMPDVLNSCCAVNLCSNFHSSASKPHGPLTIQYPDPSESKLDPNSSFSKSSSGLIPPLVSHPEPNSLSNPTFHSIVDPPSPSTVSLFALAVSHRAQSLKSRIFPLTPSIKGFYSQTPPPQGFCHQTPPSQGCYSQSLPTQVFTSKTLACSGFSSPTSASEGSSSQSSFISKASQPRPFKGCAHKLHPLRGSVPANQLRGGMSEAPHFTNAAEEGMHK